MNLTYTPAERIADGIVHVIGVCAGLAAVVAMMMLAIPAAALLHGE